MYFIRTIYKIGMALHMSLSRHRSPAGRHKRLGGLIYVAICSEALANKLRGGHHAFSYVAYTLHNRAGTLASIYIYIYIYWESFVEMIFMDFREFVIMKIFLSSKFKFIYIATADYNVK